MPRVKVRGPRCGRDVQEFEIVIEECGRGSGLNMRGSGGNRLMVCDCVGLALDIVVVDRSWGCGSIAPGSWGTVE